MPVKGRAAQVAHANGPFEIVEREFPDPAPGQVRIKVQACGLCHSDHYTKEGKFPGIQYPRVPGHEVAGVIDALGADVKGWKVGQRVGVGWLGGYCNYCESCRRGNFILCENQQICGISYDGGYADYLIAPANAVALIPDDLSGVEAGPLMCAGITTYNALRNSGARAGDTVAVLGIGGLGHLGVQFAAKSGFRTVAIARGADKAPLAKQLGAHVYIDSAASKVADELLKIGGAKIILNTTTSEKAIEDAFDGLQPDGKLVTVGVPDGPLTISSFGLIGGRRSVAGWPSGSSKDSEDTLNFSALFGVKPLVEEYSFEKTAEAYERMMSGKARFRVVLTTDN